MIVGNIGKFLLGLSAVAVDGGKLSKAFHKRNGEDGVLLVHKHTKLDKRQTVMKTAAVDTDITYCTFTDYNDADCETATGSQSVLMNVCVVGTNEDGDYQSFKYTAEESDGSWTLTGTFYSDDACETETFTNDYGTNSEECDDMQTMVCSTDSSPWSDMGNAVVTKYYSEDGCSGDLYYADAFAMKICTAYFGGIYYDATCNGDGGSLNLYSDSDCTEEIAEDEVFDDAYLDDDESDDFGDCTDTDDDYGLTVSSGTDETTCQGGGGDDESTCFAAHEMLTLVNGEQRAISDIQVGDSVLTMTATGSYVYSEVVFVPHAANHKSATFVTLQTEDGHAISMTERHLVSAGTCGAVSVDALSYVEQVQVGDCVRTVAGESRVSAVNTYRGEGVYTVVTAESNGKLVVNGVVASSFGVNHELVNSYYNIHRVLYGVFPEMMKSDKVVAANQWLGSTMAASI